MLFEVDYYGVSKNHVLTIHVKANTTENALLVANKVKDKYHSTLYTTDSHVSKMSYWSEDDFDDVGSYDDFDKVAVFWTNGGKEIFNSNKEAAEFFESKGYYYDFGARHILSNNECIGLLFGENVSVRAKDVESMLE